MFRPIIHNINKTDNGYTEVKLYNKLIANKPTRGETLHDKLNAIREWQDLCTYALERAKQAINHQMKE